MGGKVKTLDEIARHLAADEGVSWESLNDYPGYAKNIWRGEAQLMICAVKPDAIIIPGKTRWDGSMSDTLVLGYEP